MQILIERFYIRFYKVCSVNDDKKLLNRVENALFMRVYEIKGRLGVWTDDFTPHGRLVERATYSLILSMLNH